MNKTTIMILALALFRSLSLSLYLTHSSVVQPFGKCPI